MTKLDMEMRFVHGIAVLAILWAGIALALTLLNKMEISTIGADLTTIKTEGCDDKDH
jgi:hypothetical protein